MLSFFMRRGPRRLLTAPSPRSTVKKLGSFLFIIFALHISAMMTFEEMSFKDAFWLTCTTITTVGYGDFSAKTWPGRLSTVFLLYFCGIYVIADSASRIIAWRQYVIDRKLNGTWRWKMENHIVVIGSPDVHANTFFTRLVEQMRGTFKTPHIILLTESFNGNLPQKIIDCNAVHYKGTGVTDQDLEAVDIQHASHVVVLANDDSDVVSDCTSLDIISRLHDLGFKGTSVVECVNDANRGRAKRMGADAVVRPARGYPEMLVRALVAPGSEQILENFFDHAGDEVYRIDLNKELEMSWMMVVTRVVQANIGIPVGYLDVDGTVVTNPSPGLNMKSKALFVIVKDGVEQPAMRIKDVLLDSMEELYT